MELKFVSKVQEKEGLKDNFDNCMYINKVFCWKHLVQNNILFYCYCYGLFREERISLMFMQEW